MNLAVGFTVGIWTDTERSFDLLIDDFYVQDSAFVSSVDPIALGDLNLLHAYPNPANYMTTIHYHVPQSGIVELTLYNIFGKKVADLVYTERKTGTYKYQLSTSKIPNGTYLCKLEIGNYIVTRKIIVLK